MRALWACCVWIAVCVGCGGKNDGTPPEIDAKPACTSDSCGPGQICVNGECATDVCATANPCDPNQQCAVTCVPTRDACEGVTCPVGQTCSNGACYSGCFPVSACL